MVNCKNCTNPISGKFCSNCGQKTSTKIISLPNLIADLPKAVFHVDKGMLYNMIQLFKRPGPAMYDYINGKRKSFFHPASYLVISLIINYLVVIVTDLHFYDKKELVSLDPVAAKAILDYDGLQWWFLEHTYIYILIAIPASSIFLYFVFKAMKQHLNIAETAVVVLFTIAQGVLIQSTIYIIFGWSGSGSFNRTVESVNMAVLIFYASFAIYQMLTNTSNKILRTVVSVFAGVGLAVVWIASAFGLYYVWDKI